MSTWLIEPHDPLIFRDGRPFGPTPGARAKSLAFPFPSTTAGGVRTQIKTNDNGIFELGDSSLEDLKKLSVRGPFLVQLTRNGNDEFQWLVPAPLDALFLKDKQKNITLKRLQPIKLPEGSQTDFIYPPLQEQEAKDHPFYLVGQREASSLKPMVDAPHYWYWQKFEEWLFDPKTQEIADVERQGHRGPAQELRVHVGIDFSRRTGQEGALFDTSGLEFTYTHTVKESKKQYNERLALAVHIDETQWKMKEGLNCLGGERRMVYWRKSECELPEVCPEEIVKKIQEKKTCRIILLTPGSFTDVARPDFLQKEARKLNIEIEIRAIATQHPQIVSGFDMQNNRRKPSRRLAQAGSVYFVKLCGGDSNNIEQWIYKTWLRSISDDEQSRCDGFGLVAIGTWTDDLAIQQ